MYKTQNDEIFVQVQIIKMQQPESADFSDSKRKRRKRTDDQGRTFTCKCGKSYLSYPALYTHIKTKHGDEPSSRLVRSYDPDSPNGQADRHQRSETERERERLQKEKEREMRQKQKEKEREREREKQKQQLQNMPLYSNMQQVNNIQFLRQFLFKYFPNIVVNPSNNNRNQITIAQKKQLKEMKDYWQNGKKKQDQPFNQVYQTPIKYVMGKFILEIEHQVQNYSLKKFIHLFYFSIKKAVEKIKEDDSYCRVHNAGDLPLMFDTIMREYLLLDSNDFLSNPTVAAKTLYYFGRWLYANKFTNQSLKYNF